MKKSLIIAFFILAVCGCNQPSRQNGIEAGTHKEQPIAPEGNKADVGDVSNERNTALIGRWKNTEVLSSGSGDNYMSFSTEFFMEFREDGSVLIWTGKSAGAGTSRESDEANAQKGEWYTEGNTLYLIDPVTQKKAPTLFSVDESRLLLHDGGSGKKIFERVE